eukprot:scaffold56166_cov64-Phaeocystis_antarctica.AAC.6
MPLPHDEPRFSWRDTRDFKTSLFNADRPSIERYRVSFLSTKRGYSTDSTTYGFNGISHRGGGRECTDLLTHAHPPGSGRSMRGGENSSQI